MRERAKNHSHAYVQRGGGPDLFELNLVNQSTSEIFNGEGIDRAQKYTRKVAPGVALVGRDLIR